MAKDVEMGLVDHLEELRGRIILSLLAVVAIGILAYVFKDWILSFITAPIAQFYRLPVDHVPGLLEKLNQFFSENGTFTPEETNILMLLFTENVRRLTSLTFIHPVEAFMSYLKLSFYTGLLVGSPMVLYQIWRFIMPALYDNERRYFFGAFTVGAGLFYLGVAFAFYVVFPYAIQFLINMGSDQLYASLTINNYISFSMLFLLAFGLTFELPVLIYLAVRTGLTSVAFLSQKRRYVYVFAFVIAAIITPTIDPVNQAAVGVPMIVMFELSLVFCRFADRRRKARQAAVAEAESNS